MTSGEKPLSWDDEKPVEIPMGYTSKIIQIFDRIKFKVPFKKMKKIHDSEEIVLSDLTKALLEYESTVKGCFLCRFILEDFAAKGKLTGYPNDMFDKGTFPVEAKIRHIEILKYHLPDGKVERGAKPPAPEEKNDDE